MKIGVGAESQRKIPMEVVLSDGSISTDHKIVLNKWKSEFTTLLNSDNNILSEECENSSVPNIVVDDFLDCDISMGFTYPIPDRWRMCTISYSIPRWRTAIRWGVSAEARI